ncbi:glycosyltransferase family 90 protein [Paxillus involutus ATCC 200175]|uniref:Glycosyltransferase family 90 protein n=1 Tax=Paxillus involutus ATCC 200175 TaxID=664439 RepID=A0A0C9TI88_PAXIN|nr:glycosyltransferase family 90 protein [Paxillus involutus ATCC 200175]
MRISFKRWNKVSRLPRIQEAGWIQAQPPDSPAHFASILHDGQQIIRTQDLSRISPSYHGPLHAPVHAHLTRQSLSHKAGPFPQHTLVPRFSLCDTAPPRYPSQCRSWTSGAGAEAEGDVPWDMDVDGRLDRWGSTTGVEASLSSAWIHQSLLVCPRWY